jgi:hypothetical protein
MRTQQRSISVITYMEYVPFCCNKRELLVFDKMLKALQFTIHEIDHAISYYAAISPPVCAQAQHGNGRCLDRRNCTGARGIAVYQ